MSDNALVNRRQAEIDRALGGNQWERFTAPVRGFSSVAQNAIASVPQSFNRLLRYEPGTEDPDAPMDAFNLAGMAMFAPVGSVPRNALTAGRRGTINAYRVDAGVQPISPGKNIGRREQLTRLNEMAMAGRTAEEIARETMLPMARVQQILDERFGGPIGAEQPPPQIASVRRTADEPVLRMMQQGMDHHAIARETRMSPDAVLRQMLRYRRGGDALD